MKIYVAMHKVIDLILPNRYERILLGSFNKDSKDILRDDIGENISFKNQNYCELTALYWIWKNSLEEVVGLCHYRRFFSNKWYSNNSKNFLKEYQILKIVDSNTIILPKKRYYRGSNFSNINFAPNKKDMEILRKVIIDLYPKYELSFEAFLNCNYMYLYNMLIARKEILDEYSEWLFNILFEVEKRVAPNDYADDLYRKRLFGFLSERLLNVWVIYNKERIKVKEFDVVNTEESFLKLIRGKIGNWLRKVIK